MSGDESATAGSSGPFGGPGPQGRGEPDGHHRCGGSATVLPDGGAENGAADEEQSAGGEPQSTEAASGEQAPERGEEDTERPWTLGEPAPPGGRSGDRRIAGGPAASAGIVTALLGLVATVPLPAAPGMAETLVWWPGEPLIPFGLPGSGSPVGAALALVAVIAFGWARYGLTARRAMVVVAGLASLSLVGVTAARLVGPALGGGSTPAGYRLPVAMLAGLTAVGLAVAAGRGVERGSLREMAGRVVAAVAITVGAFVVLFATAVVLGGSLVGPFLVIFTPAIILGAFHAGAFLVLLATAVGLLLLQGLTFSPTGKLVLDLVLGPLAELAFVGVALAYVAGTDHDWSYIDFRWPSLLEAGLAIGGTIALLVMQFVVIAVIRLFQLPSSSQSTLQGAAEEAARLGRPELVLVLVPMMLFVVAPAEELLFRNVVQKSLYEAFDRKLAVLVAGIVFALAHVLAYFSDNHAALFVSLASIFVISLVLGFLYEVTDNLTVTTVAHGLYNSLLVVLLYLALLAQQLRDGGAVVAALPF